MDGKILNWIVFQNGGSSAQLNQRYLCLSHSMLAVDRYPDHVGFHFFNSNRFNGYSSFGLLLAFVIFQWTHFVNEVNQRQMIVYHISNHRAIEFIDRGILFCGGFFVVRMNGARFDCMSSPIVLPMGFNDPIHQSAWP